jgi:hypothetical protein
LYLCSTSIKNPGFLSRFSDIQQCRQYQSSEHPPKKLDTQNLPALLEKELPIDTEIKNNIQITEQEPVTFPNVSYTDYHPLEKDPHWKSVAPVSPPSFNLASYVNKSVLC